jgi:REP element-mobilizing transposase RayT
MRYQFINEDIPHLHITAKCHQSVWPHGTAVAWKILSESLRELQEEVELKVHSLVLMSNHYHLLCSYNLEKDPHIFEWFHEIASVNYLHSYGQWDSVLSGVDTGIFKVENAKYYQILYRYVYRNPVESHLSLCAEDYQYSTLYHILNGKPLRFKCVDDMNLIFDPGRTLQWINSDSGQSFLHSFHKQN